MDSGALRAVVQEVNGNSVLLEVKLPDNVNPYISAKNPDGSLKKLRQVMKEFVLIAYAECGGIRKETASMIGIGTSALAGLLPMPGKRGRKSQMKRPP